MDAYQEHERIVNKQLKELEKLNIPEVGQYIDFNIVSKTVKLDGNYTVEQLTAIANALDKAITEYQSILVNV